MRMSSSLSMLAGLAVGMILGFLLPESAAVLSPAGTLWFNALRMTVIPIVAAQLIVGVNNRLPERELGALGGKAFGIFIAGLVYSAVASMALSTFFLQWAPAGAPASAQAPATVAASFGDWFAGLLPPNLFQAAAEGKLIQLILASIVFGLALRQLPETRRQAVLEVVEGCNEALLVVIRWTLRVAPLGIAGMGAALAVKLGKAAVGAFAFYIVFFSAVIVSITVVWYLLLIPRGGIWNWMRAIVPAQALAFSSLSSLGTLPLMIDIARDRLRLPEPNTRFVLPLAVSLFRFCTPAGHMAGALFIAHLYGIQLTAASLAWIIPTSVILSFSAPGIPSSGLLVALPVFQQLGLPAEGVGLLLAADAIPDMFKTSSNVTVHLAVATLTSTRLAESRAAADSGS